jgi:two-component system LytT family response regulator
MPLTQREYCQNPKFSAGVESTIRALIVDDEPLARKDLRRSLQTEMDITIIGESTNGQEAAAMIRKLVPDLLFLDIEMPGMDGLSVIRSLPQEKIPMIIFITAYNQYAVDAFAVYAVDYLLKPFTDTRLEQALTRARQMHTMKQKNAVDSKIISLIEDMYENVKSIESSVQNGTQADAGKYLDRIAVKNGQQVSFIPAESINWIEAWGNYIRLHTSEKTYLLREKIGRIEQKLNTTVFIRVHRSTIVHINKIKQLTPLFHGDYRLTMSDGTDLTLSRNFRERVQALIQNNL